MAWNAVFEIIVADNVPWKQTIELPGGETAEGRMSKSSFSPAPGEKVAEGWMRGPRLSASLRGSVAG